MKFHYYIIVLMSAQFAHAMELPPSRKRGGQESEEQQLVQKQKVEQTGFQDLPADIRQYLLGFLTTAEGATLNEQLFNAAKNIRNYLSSNKSLFLLRDDKNLQGFLIKELANRYTSGNLVEAAAALRTRGASKWLVENADENIKKQAGKSLIESINEGQTNKALFILSMFPHSAYMNTEFNAVKTAAEAGNYAVLNEILETGFTQDDLDDALFSAAGWGFEKIMNLLLLAGADVNTLDNADETPLMYAAENGHTQIVKNLLEHGALVNIKNDVNNTPLTYAISGGHTKVVKLLLAAGADPNLSFPLMNAVNEGNIEAVRLLLETPGIAINTRDDEGQTALGMAQRSNSSNKDEIITLLIFRGAIE